MFYNPYQLLLTMFLFTGTFVVVTSNSWFGAWAGLEINLMAFVPLTMLNHSKSHLAPLKYFLIQAFASLILLFSISCMLMFFETYNFYMPVNFIWFSLMAKMGAAPLHFWLAPVMNGLSWKMNFILATWQKISPLTLMMYLPDVNNCVLSFFVVCSALVGGIGGVNQNSLRSLMAYSSINHLGWLLIILYLNINMASFYFLVYSLMNFILAFLFNYLNLFYLHQIVSAVNDRLLKPLMFLNLLSMGGLPPLLGFMPKWLGLIILLEHNMYILTFILVLSSLFTLYFYLRVTYCIFMMTFNRTNWNLCSLIFQPQATFIYFLSSLPLSGLLLAPLFHLY